jgi:hypothetical protein
MVVLGLVRVVFSCEHAESVMRIPKMSKNNFTDSVNWAELRKAAGLTLAQLSEMSGFGIGTINGLEKRGEGSKRLKDKMLAVLLSRSEEGEGSEIRHWRDRALSAEQKLEAVKSALTGLIKKI